MLPKWGAMRFKPENDPGEPAQEPPDGSVIRIIRFYAIILLMTAIIYHAVTQAGFRHMKKGTRYPPPAPATRPIVPPDECYHLPRGHTSSALRIFSAIAHPQSEHLRNRPAAKTAWSHASHKPLRRA